MSMFQRPIRSSEGKCNLCSISSSQLKSHVSCHLEEIAQFALCGEDRGIGSETVELCSQSEQSLPIEFCGSALEEPSIDDSSKEAIDRHTKDFSHDLVLASKLFKANERGGFKVAPESKHKTAFTSPLKLEPGPTWGLKKLQEKEAINQDDQLEEFRLALSAASRDGSKSMVKSLLENKPDLHVNNQRRCYANALQAASAAGHEGTVKLLLENGADINSQRKYDNALQAASAKGHQSIVKLLLDYGADQDAQEEFFEIALQAAITGNHQSTVEFLLTFRANINAHEDFYVAAALLMIVEFVECCSFDILSSFALVEVFVIPCYRFVYFRSNCKSIQIVKCKFFFLIAVPNSFIW